MFIPLIPLIGCEMTVANLGLGDRRSLIDQLTRSYSFVAR